MIRNSIILFFVSLLVRLCYILFFVEYEYFLIEDQAVYIKLAQQFIEVGVAGLDSERVPGYPLFLSAIYTLFSESLWDIVIIQILLDSITCVVVALMAVSLFEKGFWVAGVLAAVNLNMVILSASILTDTLFLFLFALFLFSLIKYLQKNSTMWFFLLVLFISMAVLVRASGYYLLYILFIWLIGLRSFKKDSIFKIARLGSIYILVVATLLGSTIQKNYQKYGSVALASDTGTHVVGWLIPSTYQYSGQGSYQEGQSLVKKKLKLALQSDNLIELPQNPFESSSYKSKVGKEILFEFGFFNILKAWTVGSTINLLAPSIAYAPVVRSMKHPSFYETKGDGAIDKLFNYMKNNDGLFYLLILSVGTVISIVFILLTLIGIFKMSLDFSPAIVTTLLLLIGYFLAITGPIVGTKYRLPIEPILILFVTYAINKYFLNKINKKSF